MLCSWSTWLKIRLLRLSVKVTYVKFQENLSSSIRADTGSRADRYGLLISIPFYL